MTDRLALLRAILAAPGDDTPRLVYADWLDDQGTSDADKARAEFVRLWYRLKPNLRSTTKTIGAWLGANWARLWPAAGPLVAAEPAAVQGRVLTVRVGTTGAAVMTFKAHFDRGFAALVEVGPRVFDRLIGPLAADEPVARFGSFGGISSGGPDGGVAVYPGEWPAAVFDRLAGFDRVRPDGSKHYADRSDDGTGGRRAGYASTRGFEALADAMTALAREANGLAPPETGG